MTSFATTGDADSLSIGGAGAGAGAGVGEYSSARALDLNNILLFNGAGDVVGAG
jgi:hypothetical protein